MVLVSGGQSSRQRKSFAKCPISWHKSTVSSSPRKNQAQFHCKRPGQKADGGLGCGRSPPSWAPLSTSVWAFFRITMLFLLMTSWSWNATERYLKWVWVLQFEATQADAGLQITLAHGHSQFMWQNAKKKDSRPNSKAAFVQIQMTTQLATSSNAERFPRWQQLQKQYFKSQTQTPVNEC